MTSTDFLNSHFRVHVKNFNLAKKAVSLKQFDTKLVKVKRLFKEEEKKVF